MSNATEKLEQWFAREGFGFGPIEFGEYRAEWRPFSRAGTGVLFRVNSTPLWVVEFRGRVIGTAEGPGGVREVVKHHERMAYEIVTEPLAIEAAPQRLALNPGDDERAAA